MPQLHRLASLCFLLACTACATAPFKVQVMPTGAYDPAQTAALSQKAAELPWDKEYDVALFLNQVPEGLSMEGGKLAVKEGYEDRFEIKGTLRSAFRYNPTAATAMGAFWYVDMHDQHSRSRNLFCKVQMPLRTLTLGIWWLLSPTSWPCWVTYSIRGETNLRIHSQELKRAATVLDANLVVVAKTRDERTITGNVWSVQSYTVEYARVEGFAVLDKRKPRSAAPSGATD